MDETMEDRMARIYRFQDRVVAATVALTEIILDPEFGDYAPRLDTLLKTLEWLEMSSTCGDCIEGRCHWGGEYSRKSIAEAEAGREYRHPGVGTCGCGQHEVSVQARHRRARLREAGIVQATEPPAEVGVPCHGHMHPEKGYYTPEYVVVHTVPLDRAAGLLEELSREDFEDGPRCLAKITLEGKP